MTNGLSASDRVREITSSCAQIRAARTRCGSGGAADHLPISRNCQASLCIKRLEWIYQSDWSATSWRISTQCSKKTCDHIFDDKLKWNCPFPVIFGTFITNNISHRHVFLIPTLPISCSYITLGNCRDLNIMNLALNCWFSQRYNTRILTAKSSPYYFGYLLYNLRFILEQ